MAQVAPNRERGVSLNSPPRHQMPSWDDMRLLGLVARMGSLRRAAEWLNVQAPAISKRIDALERVFRTKLFDRTARGMELTVPGRRAATGSDEMELALLETIARVRATDEARSEVRFAMGEGPADRWFIPYFLDVFLEQHPTTSLRLGTTPVAVDKPLSSFDVQMGYEPDESGNCQTVRVGKLHFVLLASKLYVERHGAPSSEAELRGHRFADVLPSIQSPSGYLQALAGLEAPGCVTFSTNSSLAACHAVQAGVAIAALPSYIYLTSPDFVPVLPDKQFYEMGIYLNFSAAAAERPEVRSLIDFLKFGVFDKLRQPWFADDFEPACEQWREIHLKHLRDIRLSGPRQPCSVVSLRPDAHSCAGD